MPPPERRSAENTVDTECGDGRKVSGNFKNTVLYNKGKCTDVKGDKDWEKAKGFCD